jgi:hypothetical protein
VRRVGFEHRGGLAVECARGEQRRVRSGHANLGDVVGDRRGHGQQEGQALETKTP